MEERREIWIYLWVENLFLTRLCHGLTPTVQLLEKLFYLHTLNDLVAVPFVLFSFFLSLHADTLHSRRVLYTPFTVYSFRLHPILPTCWLAGWLASPNAIYVWTESKKKREMWRGEQRKTKRMELNRKVAWIQSRKSQELVEHFSLNYINTHTYIIIHPTPLSCHVITFFVSFTSSVFILIFLGVCVFTTAAAS